MTGPIFRVVNALGDIEERLRRSLSLTGEVGASLQPIATPVIFIDDGQRPGCNVYRNRRFAFQGAYLTVGNASVSMRALSPVIVDYIMCSTDTSSEYVFRIAAAGTADPYALNTTGPFIEGHRSANDSGPVLGAASVTVVGSGEIFTRLRISVNDCPILPVGMFLNTGEIVSVTASGPQTGQVNFYCRVF